jgi:uncharacterized protein (TIGR03118 family)
MIVPKSRWEASLMMRARAFLLCTSVVLFTMIPKQGFAASIYVQTNLTSDVPGLAANTDPNLRNPWGMSYSATSPFWVSNQAAGNSTLYNGAGVPQGTPQPLVVATPGSGTSSGPTGQVFAGLAGNFLLNGNPSSFIFDTLGGTIDAWNGGATATVEQSVSGAQYTGLAIANNGSGNFLYAANYATGKIDVFDSTFNPTTLSGSFSDPTIAAGYVPYNIQALNGRLYVEYALKGTSTNPLAPQKGAGDGFVRVFDSNGNLIPGAPGISGGNLNAPWGVAIAPTNFGDFSNDLLVGNFGDGTINAYNPLTGVFAGTLLGGNGLPLVNNNLWGIGTRTSANFNTSAVYFVAGINRQADGLFGDIVASPEPGTMGIAFVALLGLVALRRLMTK